MNDTKVIFYYNEDNRYSINALLAAIELYEINVDISLPRNEIELYHEINKSSEIYKKVLVCMSFMSTQIWDIYKIVKNIKRKGNIILIAGGPHATGDYLGTIRMGFDIAIVGEGEETFPELLTKVINDDDLLKVKGIAVKHDDEVIFTGRRKFIDLDKYPPFPLKLKLLNPIEIMRGCPYCCFFCQTPFIFGTKPRYRSVEKVLEYVRFIKEIRGDKAYVRFIAPDALSYYSKNGKSPNIDKLEELLSGIREILGNKGKIFFGNFPSEVRPEHISYEVVKILKKYINNKTITIGAQSGSQRVLDLCNRKHTVEDVYNAVRILKSSGFDVNVDFIFGLPVEEERDVIETIKVIKDLIKIGARIRAHYFIPLPGTPFQKFKPKDISKALELELKKLLPSGKIFGEWLKQINLSKKLYQYYSKGSL